MYFGLASCIARLVAGCVCDLTRVNPRYVFQVGSLITAVSVILLPLANSQTRFILCSVFFGVGNGITLTSMNVVLLNCVEAKRRASAFGLANFLSSFSVLSSPPLIGKFCQVFAQQRFVDKVDRKDFNRLKLTYFLEYFLRRVDAVSRRYLSSQRVTCILTLHTLSKKKKKN